MTTPLLCEYFKELKVVQEKYSKVVLLFQVGSFYENYGYDNINNTEEIARLLNIICSRKDKIKPVSINNPRFFGFQCEYINKFLDPLINELYTVVTYDQIPGKSLMDSLEKRVKSNVYSPATYLDSFSAQKSVNGIMSIYLQSYSYKNNTQFSFSMSYAESSTGKVQVYECHKQDKSFIYDELYRFLESKTPRDVIINIETQDNDNNSNYFYKYFGLDKYNSLVKFNSIPPDYKKIEYQCEVLNKVYPNNNQLTSIENLDLEKYPSTIISLIILIQYINEHNELLLRFLNKPEIIFTDDTLILTNDTLYQLNLISKNPNELSLYDIINRTSTEMGARLLKSRMLFPIVSASRLKLQYEIVDSFINENTDDITDLLKRIYDLGKLFRRMSLQKLQPYDLALVNQSCKEVINIILRIEKFSTIIKKYFYNITLIPKLKEFIDYIESSFDLQKVEKGITIDLFKPGFDEEIDKNRDIILSNYSKAKALADIFTSKLPNKKVKASPVTIEYKASKYYLILSRARWEIISKELNKDSPTNNYSVIDCKSKVKVSSKELNSECDNDKIYMQLVAKYNKTIYELYTTYKKYFDDTIDYIAKLDYYVALSIYSKTNCCTKPEIDEESESSYILANGLRHPIIEKINKKTKFVPNDINLGGLCYNGMLLHGLNSCGKSILLKSVGISIILAQMGCFVPAASYKFVPFTRLISRVTYDDNMYKDQSSFIVEMIEMRTILRYSNKNTLILGDEVCKGTETVSAISIVSSAIKKLCDKKAPFIFTTHLHDISELEDIKKLSSLWICHLHAEITLDEIIYERKLKDGKGPNIYGIEVCKYLELGDDFIKNCYDTRKELLGNSNEIVSTHKSRYNQKMYVYKCVECGKTKTLETHHLGEQHTADSNGIIHEEIPYHKDILPNLVTICKDCHQKLHQMGFKLEKKQTNRGVKIVKS